MHGLSDISEVGVFAVLGFLRVVGFLFVPRVLGKTLPFPSRSVK